MTDATPRALGFRMPAEWERHEATWLTWPRRDGISFPGAYDRVPAIWGFSYRLVVDNGPNRTGGGGRTKFGGKATIAPLNQRDLSAE